MKKLINRHKQLFVTQLIIFIVLTIATGYLLYNIYLLNNIENFLRIIGGLILIFIWILIVLFTIKIIFKAEKKYYFILIIVMLSYTLLISFIGHSIYKVYGSISNISGTFTTYSASIVTTINNSATNINDVNGAKLGILSDTTSIDGHQIPKEIIKENKLNNELAEYDNYIDLISALLNNEIDYIFLPTNYAILFQSIEGYENLNATTKIIYTKDKNIKRQNTNRSTNKPFTILLMGVDSEKEKISDSSFNGDALMLITFNPNTLNATILSIPRDSYTPIACFANKRKNKITHAAWYGDDCMINTIQDMLDIKIDYYLKMNFKGVVNLVDALNGIDVDVPISFCEQDSNRNFSNLICLDKGPNHLNGEQALALARHRKTINDFIRGQNQQLVVSGLLNKLKDINSLDTVYKILDSISTNMDTSMSTNDILSFYNIGKDIIAKSKKENVNISDVISMQRLYISGYDSMIYDYSTIDNKGTKLTLYNFVPYEGSLKDISEAMKINLGITTPELIKQFSFDINNPYEEEVIGKGKYNENSIALLPSFIGDDKEVAVNYGKKRDINVTVNYTTSTNSKYKEGQIINQSLPSGMPVEYISKNKGFTITVVEKVINNQGNNQNNSTTTNFDYTTCPQKENVNNDKCLLENLVGNDIIYLNTWDKKFGITSNNITITRVVIDEDSDLYDENKIGKIVKQSIAPGTSIADITAITISYIPNRSISQQPDDTNDTENNNE